MGLVLNAAAIAQAHRAEAAPPAWLAEVVLGQATAADQASLPLATSGVLRYVWHSRYGDMLIEVIGGEVFVNGSRVQPHVA